MVILSLENLSVEVKSKLILDKINLNLGAGEICVIMGPNGSGKSTLANVLMGHPAYTIKSGRIIFKGQDITNLAPEKRAALGLFLVFQQPRAINGLDFYPFLFTAHKSLMKARNQPALDVFRFREKIGQTADKLRLKADWSQSHLNVGLSGGEKKKSEILQLSLLKPDFAIFDEIDSGLDVDALRLISRSIKSFKKPGAGAILITHYPRILKYVPADRVLVLSAGKIVAQGQADLALTIEQEGFSKFLS